MALTPENIGHLPFNIFDKRNVKGNAVGRPEIYVIGTSATNPTEHDITSCNYFSDILEEEFHGYVYYKIKDGVVIDPIVYPWKRTVDQNAELIAKGWCPSGYSGLLI